MNTFERVSEWNMKAGNTLEAVGSDSYFDNLFNQAQRVAEELNEFFEAISKRDIEGVVDAGLDLDIVVAGVNYLSGVHYADGINAILENNDLKITTDEQVAEKWAEFHTAQGVEVYVKDSYNDVTDIRSYSVRRKSDNKILKYEDFPKVGITQFLPTPEIAYYTLARNSESTLTDYAKTFNTLTLSDIIDEEGKGVLQGILDQSGQDVVRLVIRLPDNEIIGIQSYEYQEPEQV